MPAPFGPISPSTSTSRRLRETFVQSGECAVSLVEVTDAEAWEHSETGGSEDRLYRSGWGYYQRS